MTDAFRSFGRLLFPEGEQRRWIQGSPVLPNVWKAFFENPGQPADLLITPHRECRPAQVAVGIQQRLAAAGESREALLERNIAYNQSSIALSMTFNEMILHLVPLSSWYMHKIVPQLNEVRKYSKLTTRSTKLKAILDEIERPELQPERLNVTLAWWIRLIGCLSLHQDNKKPERNAIWKRALHLLAASDKVEASDDQYVRVFRIALNRPAQTACADSVRTIKADAASRVFDVSTSRICWAILDSGIDARHEAFLDMNRTRSRIRDTYDFTRVRRLIALASTPGDEAEDEIQQTFGISADDARRIRTALRSGGDVDWESLKSALRVDHTKKALDEYANGLNPHGTHVAGILGGLPKDLADGESDFRGVCPDIQLIDIRILDKQGGSGAKRGQPEFDIIAALQFVAHLNAASDKPVVHGVNLSIQLQHDPEDFACGRTPVCEECNRLVANGVVVVAAAGNMGIDREAVAANTTEGAFRDISIADPGNADSVITVGSTHRKRPHSYGVSFFSSRGPTGDGRQKPDLVAPGEKILGPVLSTSNDTYYEMQGTSQAAPHVSGAVAMLLARHNELIGDPERVKEILCKTATDLGRERHFQGAGLVDVLRTAIDLN